MTRAKKEAAGHLNRAAMRQAILFNQGVNADIFSAAPELLEACKNLLWHFAPSSRLGHAAMRTDELRDYAEAAIAKAEGK